MKKTVAAVISVILCLRNVIPALASGDLPLSETAPKSVISIISDTLLLMLKENWAFILIFVIILIIYLKRRHNEDPRNRDDD